MVASTTPWTVSQLNEAVRQALVSLPNVRVEGEISGFRPSGGHWYFELKDQNARIRCTVWRTATARMGLVPKDGAKVVVSGRVEMWVQGGTLSLQVNAMEAAGEGQLHAAYLALKSRLASEGLFDEANKLPLPFLPRAVGLATAVGGAALRDMVRILTDRYPVRMIVASVKVQGEGSAESVARGIEALDRSGLVDVIIAGRGGGSLQDLWAFNEERLVRAFAAARTPIISAVGHEIDTVLTDLAADWRAPTPTYAAERAVPKRADLQAQLGQQQQRLRRALTRQVRQDRADWRLLQQRLGEGRRLLDRHAARHAHTHEALQSAFAQALQERRRMLDRLLKRLQQAHPLLQLGRQQQRVQGLAERLALLAPRIVAERRQRLNHAQAVLQALSPRAALSRGYGIVRRSDGQPLGQAQAAQVGDRLEVLLADGALDCAVEAVRLGG